MIGKLFLTTMITLGSIGFTSPFAYSQVNGGSTITGYGTYYYTYTTELSTFDYLFGTLRLVGTGYSSTLHYEFNQKYEGTLTVKAVTTEVFNRVNVYTNNCTIMGKNSSTLEYTIRLSGVDSIDVSFVAPTQSVVNALSGQIMGITGYSFTGVDDISADVSGIHTTLGQVDAQLTTMEQSLTQILGVEQAQRTLLAEIEYAIRGNNSLYVLADDMSTIITDINNVSTIVQNIYTATRLENVMPESVNAYLLFRSLGALNVYATDKFPYYNVTSTNYQSIQSYLYNDKEYYLSLRVYNPSNINLNGAIKVYDSGGTELPTERVYHDYISNYSTVTIKIVPRSSTYYYVEFVGYIIGKSITPLYFGENVGMSQEMYSLTHIPNKLTIGLDDILNAIRNLSLNANSLTVNATGITYNTTNTEVNNSIRNYDVTINQVHGVEDDFGDTFDEYNQQFSPTTDQTLLDKFNSTSSLVNSVITSVDGIGFFQVPITLVLVGIVLMAILG